MQLLNKNDFHKWVLGIIYLLLMNGCTAPPLEKKPLERVLDYSINISGIPADTIASTAANVTFVNGRYLLNKKPYSGIVYKVLKGFNVATYSSVLHGQLHGTYRSFYASGKPYEVRQYRNGFSVGKQIGYWENTEHLKFEYNYYNQKKEGVQKNWYVDGQPAYTYYYKDDRLDGLQQAWRANGSLYRNFTVKDGVNYGLQRSKSCFEISEDEVVSQEYKAKKQSLREVMAQSAKQ